MQAEGKGCIDKKCWAASLLQRTGPVLGRTVLSRIFIGTILFYSRVQAKVGIELFGTAESMKIADFAGQGNGAEESNPWDGLKQVDLPHKGFVQVYVENPAYHCEPCGCLCSDWHG